MVKVGFYVPCIYSALTSTHVFISPTKTSKTTMSLFLNLTWVLSIHFFDYVFKCSINWLVVVVLWNFNWNSKKKKIINNFSVETSYLLSCLYIYIFYSMVSRSCQQRRTVYPESTACWALPQMQCAVQLAVTSREWPCKKRLSSLIPFGSLITIWTASGWSDGGSSGIRFWYSIFCLCISWNNGTAFNLQQWFSDYQVGWILWQTQMMPLGHLLYAAVPVET